MAASLPERIRETIETRERIRYEVSGGVGGGDAREARSHVSSGGGDLRSREINRLI